MLGETGDIIERVRGWQSKLLSIVLGLLTFELISGLYVYLAPFSASLQFMLLFHILFGLIFALPWLVYQLKHYLSVRRQGEFNKWFGYLSFLLIAVLVVSGVYLTCQSYFGTKRNGILSFVHIIAAFALLPVLTLHIGLAAREIKKRASYLSLAAVLKGAKIGLMVSSGSVAAMVFIALGIMMASYKPIQTSFQTPKNYSSVVPLWRQNIPMKSGKYGSNPFLPSNAMTSTGGFIDAEFLGRSESCGQSDCHEQIFREWRVSAHSWASTDKFYQFVEELMVSRKGVEATRFCAGCHDPVALLSGAITPPPEKRWYNQDTEYSDEGVSCIVCHAITSTRQTEMGNGNYILTPPKRYLYANRNRILNKLNKLLIRAYPKAHRESFKRELQKKAEQCAVCHQQYIDAPLSKSYFKLQHQYTSWRQSRFNSTKNRNQTVSCRECHMPLVDSKDPARGEPKSQDVVRNKNDDKHRSHRFIAANSAPWVRGDKAQIELTRKFLKGELSIPEIAHKWPEGPVTPVKIAAPNSVVRGQRVGLQVITTNNKVGHDFPAGPLDLIQAWLEVKVTDGGGKVVFQSGYLNDEGYVKGDAHLFSEIIAGVEGDVIWQHNIWDIAKRIYYRSIPPGESDVATYEFEVPKDAQDELTVKAKLRYRKFNQRITDIVNNYDGATFPVIDLSSDEVNIKLEY